MIAVADARRQPELVDEQLGSVEYTGRLGEERVGGRTVRLQIGLVQGTWRLFDDEVSAEWALSQRLHDPLGSRAHRYRLVHHQAGLGEVAVLEIGAYLVREEGELPVLQG